MCYRVSVTSSVEEIAKQYNATFEGKEPPVLFHANGFDNPPLPVITNTEPDILQVYTWGFIPPWVNSVNGLIDARKKKYLNARFETLWEENIWAKAATLQRCLIIVNGFFEFRHLDNGKLKIPYYVSRKDGKPMAFAGIYNTFTFQDVTHTGIAIVTADATGTMLGAIHNSKDRTPLILPPGYEREWIGNIEMDFNAGAETGFIDIDTYLQAWPVTKDITSRTINPNRVESISPVEYDIPSL